jgi:HSP20 family protein
MKYFGQTVRQHSTSKKKEKLMNGKLTRRQSREAGLPAQREETFWSPFQQLTRLRNEIDRLFGSPLEEFLAPTTTSLFEGWAPSVDLYEDKDKFVIRAELPGMKKEDIEVTASGDTIIISGEKKHEEETKEGKDTYRAERFFGRFERVITLPANVDAGKIGALYKDGVLTLTVPKAEEAKRKQIEVKVS